MNFVCANLPPLQCCFRQILRRVASKVAGRLALQLRWSRSLRKLYDYWRYRRESDYTARPDTPKTAAVLFQTRIWEDREARGDDPNAINDERVRLVRALKSAFQERFYGGLVPSPLSLRRHPDLVTARPVSEAA